MKGDFSRMTYNDQKQYSLVLMQQGRVQLDADWNEQAITQWLNLQNLAEDLIGEHGGRGDSFKIEMISGSPFDFTIKKGRYYVRGAMCQNNTDRRFTEQEDYFPDLDENKKMQSGKTYLVYLYLWWRHITAEEDAGIREVALAGPDTATRLKTVWQVKLLEMEMETEGKGKGKGKGKGSDKLSQDFKLNYAQFEQLLMSRSIIKQSTGLLQAQAITPSESGAPCITAPANRYRGAENQLYRVEIHRSGTNSDATFKWSRENGSVVFPIRGELGETVTLEHLGRDHRFGLKTGDWVEVVDDVYELQRRAENLLKVTAIDSDAMDVTLSGAPQLGRDLSEVPLRRPLLRRWDHTSVMLEGVVPVTQGEWLDLEDGVQIQFPNPSNTDLHYQSGDWWWIPARTVTGDVEWQRDDGDPVAQETLNHGDRYAPLALVTTDAKGAVNIDSDCRRVIQQLWELPAA